MISNSSKIKIYLVGGAVRDQLINITPKERDYVVVGATVQDLIKQGFIQVGNSFPVFLHPTTKEEYALARKEIKTTSGHQGFSFDTSNLITLEEDLFRRDLTINAIAQDLETMQLIDPFEGQKDLSNKILRHISSHFTEDPLRVLRVARFYAKLEGFTIADETITLMKKISDSGELETLSGERIFLEIQKALLTKAPWKFIEALDLCGALKIILPEIKKLQGVLQKAKYHPEGDAYVHTLETLKAICHLSEKPHLRFATLFHDIGKGNTPSDILPSHKGHEGRGVALLKDTIKRLKLPNEYSELALAVTEHHLNIHRIAKKNPAEILQLIKKTCALKRFDFFTDILTCAEADNSGKMQVSYPQKNFLLETVTKLKSLNLKDLQNKFQGPELGVQIELRYLEVIEKELMLFNRDNP